MNQLKDQTLSQIVKDHYETARVFENYGLDFCCKGKRSLVAACEENGIDISNITKELNEALQKETASTDFNRMSLTELTEYIVRVHHHYVKENLPQIDGYVQRVAGKHGDRFPNMVEVAKLFKELKTDFESHMLKEEKILFPRIKLLEITGTENVNDQQLRMPIDVMEDEHDHAGEIMQKIRKLTSDYTAPESACTTHRLSLEALKAFEADLHTHVHLENNILFPKALEKFTVKKSEAGL
jgi:regulator of cell morphogenesis and NO signaling